MLTELICFLLVALVVRCANFGDYYRTDRIAPSIEAAMTLVLAIGTVLVLIRFGGIAPK